VATLADLLAQLDPDPRRRGKQFEHVCKWYLQNDPVYAHDLKFVWLWKEWPDRWKESEAGIDLVAQTRDGKLWAIQAKDYSNPIPKSEMDKFLSESARKGLGGQPLFAYRLLIATTDELAFHAQDVAKDSFIEVGIRYRRDLEAAEINWPASFADLAPVLQPAPKSPLPHQETAIADVLDGFGTSDRGKLIMPCGTGKTLTALFIREAMAAERTLVLVPSLALLGQTVREWLVNMTADFAYKPVCSDQGVTGGDPIVASTSELGFPVTTDAEEIAAFLREEGLLPRVVFSTYQSSPEIAKALHQNGVPRFDLVIADEAHRTAGSVVSDFATVLHDEKIPAKYRLFMTATPRYFTERTQKAAKEKFGLEQASMDSEEKYGPEFYRLSFHEARLLGRLSDYEVHVILVKEDDPTYQDYLEWAVNRRLVRYHANGKITDAGKLAVQIALIQMIRKHGLSRVITFHSRIKSSAEFAETLNDVIAWLPVEERPSVDVWARHVSGIQPASKRNQELQRLRDVAENECGVLSNARCLAEGVDVPALDGEVIADPKRSVIDIIQAIGRVLRVAPGKDKGYIILPIFVRADEDLAEALKKGPFEPVWNVLRALRAHDEELADWIDNYRCLLGKLGKSYEGPVKLPEQIKPEFGHLVGEGFARAFALKLVEVTSAPWESWFGLLEQFVQQQGHARVPVACTVDGDQQLGAWANKQRDGFLAGTLGADRQRRLQSLPGWTWNLQDDLWEAGFSQLLDYVEHLGHARVPISYDVNGYNLGGWANSQRDANTRGTIKADRRRRLEELPGWSWGPQTEKWEASFRRLLDYVKQHSDARVPTSYTIEGHKVGKFVNAQRVFYTRGTLDADRQRRLEELPGWTWDPYADRWEDGFRQLLRYVEKSGDARVPKSYKVGEFRLGSWVGLQRGNHAKGTLDADRERRLKELPGWSWQSKPDQWEDGFRQLREYVERTGNARVPNSFTVDGYKLGGWVSTQRSFYAKGRLHPDRQRRLQDLPGWSWQSKADQWEEGFRRLLQYVESNGHARVPAAYTTEDGNRLGAWVNTQRTRHSTGTLKADRANRLQAVSGWVWRAASTPTQSHR
jgi:superfamily II DNA or RNA helicase